MDANGRGMRSAEKNLKDRYKIEVGQSVGTLFATKYLVNDEE
jgi:hypothetical protein